MTDTELNEKIARLMGWEQDPEEGWWFNAPLKRNTYELPDYLNPKRLHELMDLADNVLEAWKLESCRSGIHFAGKLAWSALQPSEGSTRSHALARAIVAYKDEEAKNLAAELTQGVSDGSIRCGKCDGPLTQCDNCRCWRCSECVSLCPCVATKEPVHEA